MSEIEVARTGGTCSITGRHFEPGDPFYSAVVETEQGFERRDFAPDAWDGPPENSACHFKTQMPRKDEPKRTFVDDSLLVEFFKRLEKATEDAKLRFRFVLSLILLRKRLLKYENTKSAETGEIWTMRLIKEKKSYEVFNPGLGEEEITEVSAQLGAVLATDFAEENEDGESEEANDATESAVESSAENSDDSTSAVEDSRSCESHQTNAESPVGETSR